MDFIKYLFKWILFICAFALSVLLVVLWVVGVVYTLNNTGDIQIWFIPYWIFSAALVLAVATYKDY
jgi:hypothetical protein